MEGVQPGDGGLDQGVGEERSLSTVWRRTICCVRGIKTEPLEACGCFQVKAADGAGLVGGKPGRFWTSLLALSGRASVERKDWRLNGGGLGETGRRGFGDHGADASTETCRCKGVQCSEAHSAG